MIQKCRDGESASRGNTIACAQIGHDYRTYGQMHCLASRSPISFARWLNFIQAVEPPIKLKSGSTLTPSAKNQYKRTLASFSSIFLCPSTVI